LNQTIIKKRIRWDSENSTTLLKYDGLATVCEESRCPNRNECSAAGIATYMIGGDTCTRKCNFCHINTGKGPSLALIKNKEREQILESVKAQSLSYVVITSVARDDSEKDLAYHFADITTALNKNCIEVELLIPDFHGKTELIDIIADAKPLVLAQNIETVSRLTRRVRPQAGHQRTLDIFRYLSRAHPSIIKKSGFMVGLGESLPEIEELLIELKSAGVQIVTVGQYLQPSQNQLPVEAIYSDFQFSQIEELLKELDFPGFEVGHFVRSSYMASRTMDKVKKSVANLKQD
jgi:lipoyl synthase